MMLHIPGVLTPDQVAYMRQRLHDAHWIDGRATVGAQGAQVKQNLQLEEYGPLAYELGQIILNALAANPLFFAAALPLSTCPPMFNQYSGGGTYGNHVDNAMRRMKTSGQWLRTDVSSTATKPSTSPASITICCGTGARLDLYRSENVRNYAKLLTYQRISMTTLPQNILLQAQLLPEGGVLSPKEFLHLGSRAAVDQAFCRLARNGKLLRAARGTYVVPVSSRFGTRAPAPEKVVQALAAQTGDMVTPHGANAANSLGLTQQVPVREVYLTSGRSRELKLGRSKITIKHAPRWMLALGEGKAGAAVRALAWMGPAHVKASLSALRHTLAPTEWRTLAAARASLPSWMAQAISEETSRG